jgi:hypothetical protein
MQSVIEAPEYLPVADEEPSHQTPAQSQVSGQHGFFRAMITKCLGRRPYRDYCVSSYHHMPESPVDMVARKYPYIYIQSLFG